MRKNKLNPSAFEKLDEISPSNDVIFTSWVMVMSSPTYVVLCLNGEGIARLKIDYLTLRSPVSIRVEKVPDMDALHFWFYDLSPARLRVISNTVEILPREVPAWS